MRRMIFFFLLVACYLWRVTFILAADEFETSYQVRYQINAAGKSRVSQEISLKNKLSGVYATRYSLRLQSAKIENIAATDKLGPLKTEVRQEKSATIIDLSFNERVVGKDKNYTFFIAYDDPDLVQKNGQIWEVYLPKLAPDEKIAAYQVFLIVPQSFGEPAFINPEPVEKKLEESVYLYRFSKDQLLDSGVSAAFGQFQIFDFTLSYHLENPLSNLGETEIALPPDTAFQQLSYQQIEPAPARVRIDPDGNWLAVFRLGPLVKMTVRVVGKAKIFAAPQTQFSPRLPLNLAQNLAPAKYWESDSPLIRNIAQNLKNPREIYDFVVKNLTYDFEKVNQENIERRGAVAAVISPQNSICMEFTDLFVALARAAGIPAREVNGYAYTTNQKLQPLSLVADILHSWPEYWDEAKKNWIPVDPTWGKTTGGLDYFDRTDLNHFAFAIHGESSTQPPPAGSYRNPEITGKDVQVAFGRYEPEKIPLLSAQFHLPARIVWKKESEGEVSLKNNGPKALYDLKVSLIGEKLTFSSVGGQKVTLAALPPFGEEKIPVKVGAPGWLDYGRGTVKVLVNGQEFKTEIEIGLIIWPVLLVLSLLVLIALGLAFVLKSKRQANL